MVKFKTIHSIPMFDLVTIGEFEKELRTEKTKNGVTLVKELFESSSAE